MCYNYVVISSFISINYLLSVDKKQNKTYIIYLWLANLHILFDIIPASIFSLSGIFACAVLCFAIVCIINTYATISFV